MGRVAGLRERPKLGGMEDGGHFDPAALARVQRLGGNGLVRQLVAVFLEHAPTRVSAARAAQASGDLPALARAAHALRGSAGNVGATTLAHAARRLEEAAERADSAATPDLVADLAAAFEAARLHLQQVAEELQG